MMGWSYGLVAFFAGALTLVQPPQGMSRKWNVSLSCVLSVCKDNGSYTHLQRMSGAVAR